MSELATVAEPVTFTCGECRREMARIIDVEVTAPDQARRASACSAPWPCSASASASAACSRHMTAR